MTEFFAVLSKVGVIVIMMLVGWVFTKRGILTEKGTGEITNIVLMVVTPCLIINSFLTAEPGSVSGFDLLLSFGVALAAIVLAIALSLCFFRKTPPGSRTVLRFAIAFSNAGFMGMPLVQSIVGSGGVIYASLFIVAFNLVCWTYGYSMMNKGQKLKLLSVFLNPGTIGLAIGLPLYLLRVKVPDVISAPIEGFADLNTPLAMMVVGSYVARVKFREFLTDPNIYLTAFLRLFVAPAALLALVCLIRPSRDLFLSSVIQAAAPTAANCVLFAVRFKQDAKLASKAVAATTLLSVISIPLLTVAAQYLAGLLL